MRPEKSKLLKISLCVLSCVFFGCGGNKSNGGGAGTKLTSDTIKKQLNNTHGKNAQQENSPFEKIMASAMKKVLSDTSNNNVKTLEQYINENGTIKVGMEAKLEDPESTEFKSFVEALENVIFAINTEVEEMLQNYDLTDSFGVTENAINEWKEKGLKNKEVAKVISAWQVISSDYAKFMNDPLQFLIKSGKGWMHRSTVKAIDLGWRQFVEFLRKGCEQCEKSLKTFTDKMNSDSAKEKEGAEEANIVMNAISEQMQKIKNFVDDAGGVRSKVLNKVYSEIGNSFLPKMGGEFFPMINCKLVGSEEDFKVTTAWGNAVFTHFYLGFKSDRRSFSNPASALNGQTISGLKKKGYEKLFEKFSTKYENILKDFIKFAIDKKIISGAFFKEADVENICKYLKCYGSENDKVNQGRKNISLPLWSMLCAKNKWNKICEIVEFKENGGVWTVVFKNDIKEIKDLIKDDKEYKNLEVYAGILALSNLNYGLRHYNSENGKSVGSKGKGFNLSTDLENLANSGVLNKYVLKGRLKQWDDFKYAAEKGTLKNEE